MSYFRRLDELTKQLRLLLSKEEKWLIIVNADPDAIAAALALKRIFARRVEVGLARINEITRPDNLAMIRYLRVPLPILTPKLLSQYQRFALVDSQPDHSPAFEGINFSVIIDHHPINKQNNPNKDVPFVDIRPEYGATSTMMTEYLYSLDIRPSKLLATGLLYGIRTDTATFTRKFTETDLRAYHYLTRYSDNAKLSRIAHSEFLLPWLKHFAYALKALEKLKSGWFVYQGKVEHPDQLVITADFLSKVHEIRWIVVAGLYANTVVIIFRSDGCRSVSDLAQKAFDPFGSAGGHKQMARAELPLTALEPVLKEYNNKDKKDKLIEFIKDRLLLALK